MTFKHDLFKLTQEWDYLFDISLEDGKDLKLPYNADEDPWMASQRFLKDNELPIQFLGQIAQFIKGQMPTQQATAAYVDPFTGKSRML